MTALLSQAKGLDRGDEVSILRIESPLRAPVTPELRHRVQALLRSGERRILLDLVGVSELDAAGVGELVRAYNMTTGANGVLRIATCAGSVRELLVRVGLFDLLNEHSERAPRDHVGSLAAIELRRARAAQPVGPLE
jgi:anti-anti-sigma factor